MPRVKRNIQDGYNTEFAKRLRTLIEEKDISQNQLAGIVGKTRQAVNSYTLGNTAPDSDTLTKLSEYFNVSVDYLLGLSDVRTVDKDIKFICDYTGLNEKVVSILHSEVDIYKDMKEVFGEEIYKEYGPFIPPNYFVLNDLIQYTFYKSFSQIICEAIAVMLKLDKIKKDNSVKIEGFINRYTGEQVYKYDENSEKQINDLEEKKEYLMFKISNKMQNAVKQIYLHYKEDEYGGD